MISKEYQEIIKQLDDWQLRITRKSKISVSSLVRAFKTITRSLPVQVNYKISQNSGLDSQHVILSAVYDDSELEDNLDQIDVYVNVLDKNSVFEITQTFVQNVRMEFLQTLMHELEHRSQALSRIKVGDKYSALTNNKQEYLSSRDEVNAYACGIAVSLWDRYATDSWKILRQPGNVPGTIHSDLAFYQEACGQGLSNTVWKQLLGKTARALYQLEIYHGQRFKTGTN